jgi:hypothetical protein
MVTGPEFLSPETYMGCQRGRGGGDNQGWLLAQDESGRIGRGRGGGPQDANQAVGHEEERQRALLLVRYDERRGSNGLPVRGSAENLPKLF